MKKSKFLGLVLGASLMLVGAGYAAWDDKLEVKTTVDTGELNVQFVGPNHQGGSIYYASPRMYYLHADADPIKPWQWDSATPNDLLSSSVTYGAKAMTFTFGNMYPGTRGAGLYTVENNGTIPAVIDNVTVTTTTTNPGPDGVADVEKAMVVSHSWLKIVRDGTAIAEEYITSIPLANLETTLENFLRGKRLQPNDKITLGSIDNPGDAIGELMKNTFNFELPLDSLTGNAGEKEVVEINVEFDFVQHNAFDPTP